MYAEGKGTEMEQVLQATINSQSCLDVQSTCVNAASAHSGSRETARIRAQACKAQEVDQHDGSQRPTTQQGSIMTMIWHATMLWGAIIFGVPP